MSKINVSVILIFALMGCLAQKEIGEGELSFPQADFSSSSGIDKPEGLARATSDIYKRLIDGESTTSDVYPRLLEYSVEASKGIMKDMQLQFSESIKTSRDFFSGRDWHIKEFVISEAVYTNDSMASVYRIQIMNNGKLYYFKQDFILEKGVWKIRGDNVSDPFKIILRKN